MSHVGFSDFFIKKERTLSIQQHSIVDGTFQVRPTRTLA
jgi:hypothetical protein